jgi:FMN-dependent NADH-azoreductase
VISVANRRIGALADLNSVLAVFGMEIAASADQAAAWGQIRSIATRFLAAAVLVLAVPLRNFSVPYKLNLSSTCKRYLSKQEINNADII